jgi:hypothetical protein
MQILTTAHDFSTTSPPSSSQSSASSAACGRRFQAISSSRKTPATSLTTCALLVHPGAQVLRRSASSRPPPPPTSRRTRPTCAAAASTTRRLRVRSGGHDYEVLPYRSLQPAEAFAFRELDMTRADCREMAWLHSTVYSNPDPPVEELLNGRKSPGSFTKKSDGSKVWGISGEFQEARAKVKNAI